MRKSSCLIAVVFLFFSCREKITIEYLGDNHDHTHTDLGTDGFPQMPISEDNQTSLEGIALGRKLFYDPILSASIPDFPATAIGDTSVRMMQIANAGSGQVNATVSATGDLKFFHPGLGIEGVQTLNVDTLGSANPFMVEVHYIPTEQGVSDDSISVVSPQSVSGDGVVMDAGSFMKVPDANAGAQAATFEDSWIGWFNYSLEGVSSAAYGSDRWRYYSGSGHNSSFYAGVNGFIPFNGGVNDFLVSPRLSNNSDVLSFFTKGGYDGNLGPYAGPFVDSMVVWISDEKPNMGYGWGQKISRC